MTKQTEVKTTVSAETVADFKNAWKAAEQADKAASNAADKARQLAKDLVAEFKLATCKTGELDAGIKNAIANVLDASIASGLKIDVTTREYSNFKAHVSTFCVCYARPETPIETTKQDKAKTKEIKPASVAADKSIKEAQAAAKAIREGEGASGNNKEGKNGAKPSPAPAESLIVKPVVSFADIQPKLEEMLADKEQTAMLVKFLAGHGFELKPIKATSKPAKKQAAKPNLPSVAETLAPAAH